MKFAQPPECHKGLQHRLTDAIFAEVTCLTADGSVRQVSDNRPRFRMGSVLDLSILLKFNFDGTHLNDVLFKALVP